MKCLSVEFLAKRLAKWFAGLQGSPSANYILGGIVPSHLAAYSHLHVKSALNFPTYSRAGAGPRLSSGHLLLASMQFVKTLRNFD
jgi:hypothetical protein